MEDIYTHERVGHHITFVDAHGKAHEAIVTADWSVRTSDKPGSVNLVIVSDDPSQTDSYGRQIARFTSVPHQENQSAFGMYWK